MFYAVGAAIVAAVLLGLVTVAVSRRSENTNRIKALGIVLAAIAISGALLTAVGAVLFYAGAAGVGSSETVIDAFKLFFTSDLIFCGICLAVTLTASLSGHNMRAVRQLLAMLWAVLSLMWTALCMAWSEYDGFSAAPYCCVCGIGIAAVLCAAGSADLLRLSAALRRNDTAAQRKAEIYARGDGRRERIRRRELKKKISRKH